MSNFLSTPKLTLKNTILIKRRTEDFTTTIFLPQRYKYLTIAKGMRIYGPSTFSCLSFCFILLLSCNLLFLYFVFEACIVFLWFFFLVFLCMICFANIYNLKLLKKWTIKQEKILFKTRPSNTVSVKVLNFKIQFALFAQFLKYKSYKVQKMGTRAFGQLPPLSFHYIGYSH